MSNLAALRRQIAAAIDPEAFDETKEHSKHPAALVQVAARQHMAYEAAEKVMRPIAEAVDLCWKATPYGETEDGDTAAYILPKGVVHRLVGALQGVGVSASLRIAEDTCRPVEVDGEIVRVRGADGWTDKDHEMFTEIVRAVKRRLMADDLAAWLTQIWDEDEKRISAPTFCAPVWPTADKMLARIAADRKILARCFRMIERGKRPDREGCWEMIADLAWDTLDDLASAYADRPGYREDWRP